jgi:hypothetical protein
MSCIWIINAENIMCSLHRWSPDAIVFNSWQHYGCPNYWMLHFFKDSSGATFHPTTTQVSNYDQMVASAITWQSPKDKSTYLKIKVLPFCSSKFQSENSADQPYIQDKK